MLVGCTRQRAQAAGHTSLVCLLTCQIESLNSSTSANTLAHKHMHAHAHTCTRCHCTPKPRHRGQHAAHAHSQLPGGKPSLLLSSLRSAALSLFSRSASATRMLRSRSSRSRSRSRSRSARELLSTWHSACKLTSVKLTIY